MLLTRSDSRHQLRTFADSAAYACFISLLVAQTEPPKPSPLSLGVCVGGGERLAWWIAAPAFPAFLPMDSLSRDEFVALFLEAHPRLWTVAAAVLGDRDLAEDVVQDAAMTGLDRLDSYKRGTNFPAWMAQIVRFTALNHLKQLRRRNTGQAGEHMLEGAIAPALANPTSIAPASQFACGAFEADQLGFDDQLAAAIAKLAPERRACLLLRIVQSMSYEEIAATLGIPASTAMSHVHRAKHALKAFLDGEPAGDGGEL